MPLLLPLAACTASSPDAGADSDSDSDTDTDTDTHTDTGADTGADTEPSVLPGDVEVSGTYAGVAFAFACTETDGSKRFSRYWGHAVGDIAGGFGCTDESSLSVTFINPAAGTWAAPEGTTYSYYDASGGSLSYYAPTPTAWALTLDDVSFVDAETLSITGSLAGTWDEGDVAATFSLSLPCTNC